MNPGLAKLLLHVSVHAQIISAVPHAHSKDRNKLQMSVWKDLKNVLYLSKDWWLLP